MSEQEKCWGEQQGIQGCAACPKVDGLFNFYRGDEPPMACMPKLLRRYSKEEMRRIIAKRARPNSTNGS